jgi:hypothetical protein
MPVRGRVGLGWPGTLANQVDPGHWQVSRACIDPAEGRRNHPASGTFRSDRCAISTQVRHDLEASASARGSRTRAGPPFLGGPGRRRVAANLALDEEHYPQRASLRQTSTCGVSSADPAPAPEQGPSATQPKLTVGTSPSPSPISKNSLAEKPKAMAMMFVGTWPILVL